MHIDGGVRGVLRYVRHINSTVWLLYLFIVFDRRGLLDRNSSECHFCVCVCVCVFFQVFCSWELFIGFHFHFLPLKISFSGGI